MQKFRFASPILHVSLILILTLNPVLMIAANAQPSRTVARLRRSNSLTTQNIAKDATPIVLDTISKVSKLPFAQLTLTGTNFDVNQPTMVLFSTAKTNVSVPASDITATSVTVVVPALTVKGKNVAGAVLVQVVQGTAPAMLASNTIKGLKILPLPKTPKVAGTALLGMMQAQQGLLSRYLNASNAGGSVSAKLYASLTTQISVQGQMISALQNATTKAKKPKPYPFDASGKPNAKALKQLDQVAVAMMMGAVDFASANVPKFKRVGRQNHIDPFVELLTDYNNLINLALNDDLPTIVKAGSFFTAVGATGMNFAAALGSGTPIASVKAISAPVATSGIGTLGLGGIYRALQYQHQTAGVTFNDPLQNTLKEVTTDAIQSVSDNVNSLVNMFIVVNNADTLPQAALDELIDTLTPPVPAFTGSLNGSANFANTENDCTFTVIITGTFAIRIDASGTTGTAHLSGGQTNTVNSGTSCIGGGTLFNYDLPVTIDGTTVTINGGDFPVVVFNGTLSGNTITGTSTFTFPFTTGSLTTSETLVKNQ